MSIIDNVAELHARLEEIEAEKAAGIKGEYGVLSPEMYEGLKETIPPPPGWVSPQRIKRMTEDGPFYYDPHSIGLRDCSLESKAEMLKSQVRMYTRLRAECIQALTETEARIAVLRDKQ